ncbi:hypothetical protein NPIL_250871 [Nephila pilipes]|uniref:Uncharacterized protein n=1 Tax=Nephila pilipes TaxID=299642 RepID=A0A8X6PD67_NEPPI|nr:hypothetical protein NPIL_250871 [Nephila pilipes]
MKLSMFSKFGMMKSRLLAKHRNSTVSFGKLFKKVFLIREAAEDDDGSETHPNAGAHQIFISSYFKTSSILKGVLSACHCNEPLTGIMI